MTTVRPVPPISNLSPVVLGTLNGGDSGGTLFSNLEIVRSGAFSEDKSLVDGVDLESFFESIQYPQLSSE